MNESSAVAEAIFAAFPEWRALARVQQAADGSSFLVVEVTPPPAARAERGLIVHTANGEVTVGFDHYHAHFDRGVADGEPFGLQAALELARQILEERVAIASWWFDDEWQSSSQIAAGSSPSPPSGSSRSNRVRVRSWRGTFNLDASA
jgi:hypothetical protein